MQSDCLHRYLRMGFFWLCKYCHFFGTNIHLIIICPSRSGPHGKSPDGQDIHATARVFSGPDRRHIYLGGVHFACANRKPPTFKAAESRRKDSMWTGSKYQHHITRVNSFWVVQVCATYVICCSDSHIEQKPLKSVKNKLSTGLTSAGSALRPKVSSSRAHHLGSANLQLGPKTVS